MPVVAPSSAVPPVALALAGAEARRPLPQARAAQVPWNRWTRGRPVKSVVAVPALLATVVALPAVVAGLLAGVAGRWTVLSGLVVLTAVVYAVVPVCLTSPSVGIRGVERALRAHRACGWLVVALATAHAAFVLTRTSAPSGLLSPVVPARIGAATAGVAAALVGVLALVGHRSSRGGRSRHRLERRLHIVLAVIVTGATLLHLLWSSSAAADTVTRDAVVLTAGLLILAVARRLIGTGLAGRRPFVVERVRTERPGVRTLVLRGQGWGHLRDLRAGQVVGLRLDTRGGEQLPGSLRITSVGSEPGCIELALDLEDGALSSLVQLWPGRRVFAGGLHEPTSDGHQGSLLLVADHREVPLALGLLRMQAARCDRRPHCLLVTGRDRSDLLLRRELAEVGGRLDLDVVEVLSQPPLTWTGRRGRVDGPLLREVLGQYRSFRAPHAYVFGPTSMAGEVRTALRGVGLAERRIHADLAVHAT